MCKLRSKQHCCHLFKTKVHLNENTWHPLRFLYLLPCTVCTSLAYSSPRDESLYYLLISTVVLQITTLLPQQAALCCRDVPSHNCELCIGCEVGLRVAIVKVKILLNESQLLKWPFNVILNHHWLALNRMCLSENASNQHIQTRWASLSETSSWVSEVVWSFALHVSDYRCY